MRHVIPGINTHKQNLVAKVKDSYKHVVQGMG